MLRGLMPKGSTMNYTFKLSRRLATCWSSGPFSAQPIMVSAFLAISLSCSPSDRTLGLNLDTSVDTSADMSDAALAISKAPVATVVVSPAAVSLPVGDSRQLSVVLRDAKGHRLTGRDLKWTSSVPGVATVSPAGLLSAITPGTSFISATSEGKSDTATVTVTSEIEWLWEAGLETDQPFTTRWSHPGAVVDRTTDAAHAGLYSLKLTTPSTIYRRASALKVSPFAAQIHAVDLWFYLPAAHGKDVGFEVAMEGWSGTEQHLASFHWVQDQKYGLTGWRRWVGGKWEFLPGGQGVTVAEGAWHHFHAEVDYVRKTYRKMVIDGRTFDLTGLPYDASPRITPSAAYNLSILLWNQTPTPRTAFLDDVRLGKAR